MNASVVFLFLFFGAVAVAQNEGSPDLPSSQNMYNCNKDDAECWNAECLHWTNVIRKEAGVAPLAMGSVGMLDNAVSYSRKLDAMKGLKHQDIGAIKLPCGMEVFGENIAYNFAEENPAWKCMNQWKKSPGHYKNIVRERFASVVTGVFISGEGRVSCTQIFSPTLPEGGQPKCEACPTNFPRGSSPESTPKPAATMTAFPAASPAPTQPMAPTMTPVPSTSPTSTVDPIPSTAEEASKDSLSGIMEESPAPESSPEAIPVVKSGNEDCKKFSWSTYECMKCPGDTFWSCRAKQAVTMS